MGYGVKRRSKQHHLPQVGICPRSQAWSFPVPLAPSILIPSACLSLEPSCCWSPSGLALLLRNLSWLINKQANKQAEYLKSQSSLITFFMSPSQSPSPSTKGHLNQAFPGSRCSWFNKHCAEFPNGGDGDSCNTALLLPWKCLYFWMI